MKIEWIQNGFSQHVLLENRAVYLKICNQETLQKETFNTVLLHLDASISSLLHWEEQIENGREFKKRGFWLLWELDFSLPALAFFDSASLLTLELAVEHFMKVIWSEFHDSSIGAVFFRGKIEEARKHIDALKLLNSRLGEDVCSILFLDTFSIEKEAEYFHLCRQDFFTPFGLALKGRWPQKFPRAFPSLGWDHLTSPYGFFSETQNEAPISTMRQSCAIHLPDYPNLEKVQNLVDLFSKKNFRMISDALLTEQWQGVDHLFVFSDAVDERTKRKLLGFCAAGGIVVSDAPIGLANEIALRDFISSNL